MLDKKIASAIFLLHFSSALDSKTKLSLLHGFVVSVRTSSVSQLDLEQGLTDLVSECYELVKKLLF